MKLGIIARSEDRGLGLQTWEATRHLNPDRVLLVEPQPSGWFLHPERYAGYRTTTVPWRHGKLPEGPVRQWLDGLDVVYTAESDYDLRMSAWCSAAGVTLVRHANPEQLSPEEVKHSVGTVWWSATPWRLHHLPAGTRVVPMPVALDRFPIWAQDKADKPVRFLHSIGHQAQDDRAGSRYLARAIRYVAEPCELVVRSQSRDIAARFQTSAAVTVEVHGGGVGDYWRAYDGCDVLVIPRRYGGLSLPNQEAMAAGLALVTTDCSPNEIWPGVKLPVRTYRDAWMRCGLVQVACVDPQDIADVMSDLAKDRNRLAGLQAEARTWAEAHSWEALTPLWMAELKSASSSRSAPAAALTA